MSELLSRIVARSFAPLIGFLNNQQEVNLRSGAHQLELRRYIRDYRKDLAFKLIQEALQLLLGCVSSCLDLVDSIFHCSFLLYLPFECKARLAENPEYRLTFSQVEMNGGRVIGAPNGSRSSSLV